MQWPTQEESPNVRTRNRNAQCWKRAFVLLVSTVNLSSSLDSPTWVLREKVTVLNFPFPKSPGTMCKMVCFYKLLFLNIWFKTKKKKSFIILHTEVDVDTVWCSGGTSGKAIWKQRVLALLSLPGYTNCGKSLNGLSFLVKIMGRWYKTTILHLRPKDPQRAHKSV